MKHAIRFRDTFTHAIRHVLMGFPVWLNLSVGHCWLFAFISCEHLKLKKIWNWHLMILSTGHLGALLLRFKMLARNLYQTSTSITNYTINQPSYESSSYQLHFSFILTIMPNAQWPSVHFKGTIITGTNTRSFTLSFLISLKYPCCLLQLYIRSVTVR